MKNPDPREDPKSRSLNGGSYKVPLVVQGPKLGDLLSRSSLKGSGKGKARNSRARSTKLSTGVEGVRLKEAFADADEKGPLKKKKTKS